MIRRHPHVFGDVKVSGSSEVLQNWDDIKKEEKGAKTQSDIIKKIPMELPALIRSLKVQQKISKALNKNGNSGKNGNSDKNNSTEEVISKIEADLDKLKGQAADADKKTLIGDLLFSVVSLAGAFKVYPEIALNEKTDEFIENFEKAEVKQNEIG